MRKKGSEVRDRQGESRNADIKTFTHTIRHTPKQEPAKKLAEANPLQSVTVQNISLPFVVVYFLNAAGLFFFSPPSLSLHLQMLKTWVDPDTDSRK